MAYRLGLYGAGKRCKRLCKILEQFDVEIMAIIDSNPAQWGKIIEGYEVKNQEELSQHQDITVCITIMDLNALQDIQKLLEEYLYDLKRVISYNEDTWSEILQQELDKCFRNIFDHPERIRKKGRKSLEKIRKMHNPYEYQKELRKNLV